MSDNPQPPNLHATLVRQIKKAGASLTSVPPTQEQWEQLLSRIDRSYRQSDEDRYTLERSLEISSKEMSDLYEELSHHSRALLSKERDKLQAVIKALGEGLAVLEPDGKIRSMNPEGCQLLKLTLGEVEGDNFFSVVGLSSEEVLEKFELLRAGAHSWENVYHRENEVEVPLLFTLSPIAELDGQLAGLVVVFRDITVRMQAERATELARDAALNASRAKSDFLASMSHEIRTPLNGIISLVELLLDSNLDEEQRTDVTTIQDCADSLRGIITNVLDLSKIEARKLHIEAVKSNPVKLIEKVTTQLKVLSDKNQQRIVVQGLNMLPETCLVDPVRFEQILVNLVGNAIKFSPKQGVIKIVCEIDRAATPDQLVIKVVDQGIGISKEKQDTIFESFSQADGSINRRFGGTGLGLTICALLLELMGGRIWVESEEGCGSTFSFTLPIEFVDPHAEAPVGAPAGQQNVSAGLRILLVEDNTINQDTIARMLKRKQHVVTVAENGKVALDTLQENQFDLILMDLHMPVMDGLEASKRIRQMSNGSQDTPIIALTAHAIKGVKEECLEAGMSEYLTKPIDYEILYKLIAELGSSRPKTV